MPAWLGRKPRLRKRRGFFMPGVRASGCCAEQGAVLDKQLVEACSARLGLVASVVLGINAGLEIQRLLSPTRVKSGAPFAGVEVDYQRAFGCQVNHIGEALVQGNASSQGNDLNLGLGAQAYLGDDVAGGAIGFLLVLQFHHGAGAVLGVDLANHHLARINRNLTSEHFYKR